MVSLFLKYLRLHYFANQALLLIVYRFYGCPVNYFVTVQIFSNSYTGGSDFWSNSEA